MEAQKAFMNGYRQLAQQSSGYKSWGEVRVLKAAIRQPGDQYLLADLEKDPEAPVFTVQPIGRSAADPFAALLRKRKAVDVVLITEQFNASKVTEDIPPILDDQAQLLGPTLRWVKRPEEAKRIAKALSGRYAANLKGGLTICIGKTLEEAYIAAQLVEKTSKAWLGAKNIGGAKSINRLEAWAMHKFYMLKYSRESERNR